MWSLQKCNHPLSFVDFKICKKKNSLFFYRLRITNLKYWTRSERIISKTLSLLNDLSVGYSSVRKLMKLDSIHFLLIKPVMHKAVQTNPLELSLSSVKLIEELSLANMEEFSLYQWIFLFDSKLYFLYIYV